METLRSARRYNTQQRAFLRRLLVQARAHRFGSLNVLVGLMAGAQEKAANDGAQAVSAMLAEQNIDADPDTAVRTGALAGTASDGRSLSGLMSFVQNSQLVTPKQFDRVIVAQTRDAGRNGSSLAIAARPQVSGYVRMLSGSACGRCAILAGAFYRYNTGFERHPNCGCVHVPADENTSGDLRTDPSEYFDSLPTAADLSEQHPDLTAALRREAGLVSQEDVFTKAGAQAIRDGADPAKVMNARAGMSTAQIAQRGKGSRWTAAGRLQPVNAFGRDVYVTSESTTVRGVARKAMGKKPIRLMPESIYKIAENRADAIRLLKLYGYLK